MEICICAAIRLPDGYIIRGQRHDDCYNFIRKRPDSDLFRLALVRAEQGFLTTHNRFVDREEGMQLQRAAGEISHYTSDGVLRGEELFSEDLYPNPCPTDVSCTTYET